MTTTRNRRFDINEMICAVLIALIIVSPAFYFVGEQTGRNEIRRQFAVKPPEQELPSPASRSQIRSPFFDVGVPGNQWRSIIDADDLGVAAMNAAITNNVRCIYVVFYTNNPWGYGGVIQK